MAETLTWKPEEIARNLDSWASRAVVARGRGYQRQGRVLSVVGEGLALSAEVEGTAPRPYQLTVTFDASGRPEADCDCPFDWEPPVQARRGGSF